MILGDEKVELILLEDYEVTIKIYYSRNNKPS